MEEKKRYHVKETIHVNCGVFNASEKGENRFPPESFNKDKDKIIIEGSEMTSNIMVLAKAGKNPDILSKLEKARRNGIKDLTEIIEKSNNKDTEIGD